MVPAPVCLCPLQKGWHGPWQVFLRKAMWGHALGKDVSPLRKSRVGQEDAASGGSHGKGQECIRAAAVLVCGGCLHELQQVSGCCSVRREEGCGHSRITLPGLGRWHNQHSAARGEQRPMLALPVACPPPPSLGPAPLAPCKQTAGLCAVQTRWQATQTPSQHGRVCAGTHWPRGRIQPQEWAQVQAPPQQKSRFGGVWVGTHWSLGCWYLPRRVWAGGGTHPHQPHYLKVQPNLTRAHPLPHS